MMNLLTISVDFMAGSCPLIFGWKNHKFKYIGEALVDTNRKYNIIDYSRVLIYENDDEICYIDSITFIGYGKSLKININRKIRKNEYILIDVPRGYNEMLIRGRYEMLFEPVRNDYSMLKKVNRLIALQGKVNKSNYISDNLISS